MVMSSSVGPEIVVMQERWVAPAFIAYEKLLPMQVPLTLPLGKHVVFEKVAEPVTEDPVWLREIDTLPPLVPLELTQVPVHCPATSTAGDELPTPLLPLPPPEQLMEPRTARRPRVSEATFDVRRSMACWFRSVVSANGPGTRDARHMSSGLRPEMHSMTPPWTRALADSARGCR
jgi:hypothetical protein